MDLMEISVNTRNWIDLAQARESPYERGNTYSGFTNLVVSNNGSYKHPRLSQHIGWY